MKKLCFVLFLTTAATLAASAQAKSVYTSSKMSECRTISSNPKEAGSYEGECPGVGGYKVRLLEGDLRQSINILTPARKKYELNLWSFYSGFSSIGDKIEWRTKKGIPFAIITRFNVADNEDSTKTTSYLLVAKIGKNASCVTDVVLPKANQNEEARRLADASAGKPCKAEE
jgi:hypothetical protein